MMKAEEVGYLKNESIPRRTKHLKIRVGISTKLFANVQHEIEHSQTFIDHMSQCDRKLQWQNLKVYFGDQLLPPITLSMGIAIYPDHGIE